MKKIIMIVLMLVLITMISGCKKEVDYYCEFTNYEGGSERWYVIDDYKKVKGSTIVEVYHLSGDIWEVDLDEYKMICVEMEEVE